MLQFDDKTHTASYQGQSLSLPPLSYRLLKALAQPCEQLHSLPELMDQVWINTQVSPETLKQRVFVLRKALDEAGFSALSIQAVRGEGYRLLLDTPPSEVEQESESVSAAQPSSAQRPSSLLPDSRMFTGLKLGKLSRRHTLFFGMATVVITVLAAVWLWLRTPDFTINNRVLLWSNLPVEQMTVEGRTAFETWRSLLVQNDPEGALQLIFSHRIDTMSVPIQARKDRAGLISHFEWLNNYQGSAVRLSIIEPRTATVLRSDVIDLSEPRNIQQSLNGQYRAISALIYSDHLCMTKAQRENSQAPVWQALRELANRS